MIIWILLLLALVYVLYLNRGGFILNDITTTPDDPPQFTIEKPYPEFSRRLQKKYYTELQPLKLRLSESQAFDIIRNLVKARGWEIVHIDGSKIEAVATTPLMRFKDDIVIEIRPAKEGSEIHMRSKSRIGKGDLGENARRIRKLLSDAELQSHTFSRPVH